MSKLVIEHNRHAFYIAWEFEDDIGGTLGQSSSDGCGKPPSDREDWEHWAACKAILENDETFRRGSTGFEWASLKDAKAALALAKGALKFEKPLPDWAKTAIKNGWKPPRGWKP